MTNFGAYVPRSDDYTLEGKVLDANGNGVPGILVEAWDKDMSSDDMLGSDQTTADGSFTIRFNKEDFQPALWELFDNLQVYFKLIRSVDQQPLHQTGIRLHNKQPGVHRVKIQLPVPALAPAAASQAAAPQAGQQAAASQAAAPQAGQQAAASQAGQQAAAPQAGQQAAAPQAATQGAVVQQHPGNSGEIKGVLYYDLSGDLIRKAGDQGLPNVQVSLKATTSGAQTTPPPVFTDSEGTFHFPRVPAGRWILQLPDDWKPGVQPMAGTEGWPRLRLSQPNFASFTVTVLAGRPTDVGAIGYEAAGGYVTGIIFFDEDGTKKPDHNPRLAEVPVTLVQQGKSRTTGKVDETDAQGVYYFTEIDSGTYQLQFPATFDATDQGWGMLQRASDLPMPFNFMAGQQEELITAVRYVTLGGAVRGVVFKDRDGSGRRFGTKESGLGGVTVLLEGGADKVRRSATTANSGEYTFPNIPAGTYTLRFAEEVRAGQDRAEYTLTDPEAKTQTVIVIAGETTDAEPTGYQPETHEIRGRAIYEDNTPVPGLVVTLADPDGVELDTAVTNGEGYYVFKDRRGDFVLKFPPDPFAGQLLSPQTRGAHVESIANMPDTRYRAGGGGGAGDGVGPIGGIQDAVVDIAAYMPTGQEADGGGGRGGSRGAGGPAPLQQVVTGALTDVLGHKLKTNDPTAFLASLNRAFTLQQFEGRTVYQWTPRTYAVQTELGGALTGAQASIYHRARVALDDALPLLDGLKPLTPNPDSEEIAAVQAIVRTEMTELVNELGMEGGPRVQRVDDLFHLLTYQLARLEEELGLDPEHVNTVEEEQNLTNYLVVRDHVRGLAETWSNPEGLRSQFTGNSRFLGTQLVLLSRALSVVAESVEETEDVMESVLLGPHERQTVLIRFPRNVRIGDQIVPIQTDSPGRPVPPMLVDELLSWVQRFAAEEGPALIQDGGRRGVATVQPTAARLQRLVFGAAQAEATHVGLSRTRVKRALQELAQQLGHVDRLCGELLLQGQRIN